MGDEGIDVFAICLFFCVFGAIRFDGCNVGDDVRNVPRHHGVRSFAASNEFDAAFYERNDNREPQAKEYE